MKTLYTIGIDFGTSNSCVCYASYNLRPDGNVDAIPAKRPEALALQHADTIPTVVFLGDEAGQPTLFGEIAEERAVFYPDLTRSGFKLNLGLSSVEGAEAFMLTKQFLSYLRGKIAEYVPLDRTGDEIHVETYVGHPVQWTTDQREETVRAAREAGFPNVRLESESLAAVYCHLCETGSTMLRSAGSQVMMIDMGGGTTDFAFLELADDPKTSPESRPVDPALVAEPWGAGRRSYGGRDLDMLLLDHFLDGWGYTQRPKEYPALMREMRRFKERFSTNIEDGVNIYHSNWLVNGQQKSVQLDQETFERLTTEYRAYFKRLVQTALVQVGLKAEDVSAIILTGGHSRWYFVEEALKDLFPQVRRENQTLLRHNHPEQSVARGLCYSRMVMAQAGESQATRRKATHSLWVGVSPQPGSLETTLFTDETDGHSSAVNYEPVLLMPERQLLPYRPGAPVSLQVQRLALDNHHPVINLRLYSGVQDGVRVPLMDRTATFQRGVVEGVMKQISRRMPWATDADEDRFLVDVFCVVDENEIVSGKVVITRYWRDRVMAVQTQPLQVDPARRMLSASPTLVASPRLAAAAA
ncbi:MAG: Hsp70 family protein [Armatimonadota bacterium]|nr:Hsp70 family protein [Armatimonadota bacterium]